MNTMSLYEIEQRAKPQQDIFRTLLTDSKLMFLSHAIEHYEKAQLHLRQNEEQQRQVRQYLEYNRERLLELDLRERFILLEHKKANFVHGDPSERESSTALSTALMRESSTLSAMPNTVPTALRKRVTSESSLPLRSYGIQRESGACDILNRMSAIPNPLVPQQSVTPLNQQSASLKSGSDRPNSTITDDQNSEHVSKKDNGKKCIVRDYNKFKDTDVLFERGNFAYNHPGNRNYRAYVKNLQEAYVMSKRIDKVSVTARVLYYIQKECGGRFMGHDEDSGAWRELTPDEARRKVCQSLRERNKKYLPPPRSRKNVKRVHHMIGPLLRQEIRRPIQHGDFKIQSLGSSSSNNNDNNNNQVVVLESENN